MMKLGCMTALIATIAEDGNCPIAERILARWAHDPAGARLLRASSNFIFTFQNDGQPCILRFTPSEQRSMVEIEAEMAFLRHLGERGLRANQPIVSLDGKWVESYKTPLGVMNAVALTVMPGKHLELNDFTPAQFTAWGQALGELHNAAQGWPGSGRPTWRTQLGGARRRMPAGEDAALDVMERLQRRLAEWPVSEQNFGLIHYDFELDNLLWQDGTPAMIDFDDGVLHWFAADVAYALRDLCGDRPSQLRLDDERLGYFLAGYRAMRALPDEEVQRLPLYLLYLNAVMLSELLEKLDESPSPAEPEWAGRVRKHLEGMTDKFREELSLFPL